MTAKLEVEGTAELDRAYKACAEGLQNLSSANMKAAEAIAERARPITPFRTGALADSIRAASEPQGIVTTAGNERVAYAGVIHWGSSSRGISANPFITNAIDEAEPQWSQALSEGVQDVVNDAVTRYAKTGTT